MAKNSGWGKRRLFLICLFISFLAWFAVKMSKNYQQTYDFAIEFTNLPNGKEITSQSDTMISINFESQGVYLLPLEFRKKVLEVDYDAICTPTQKKCRHIVINKEQLANYIAEYYPSFPENMQILNRINIALTIDPKQEHTEQ
ncbi:MAG: hypothetical protein J5701_08085 [Bacteroidales bacterium]|nr:hypothetical protein [Bacteroidales bacterium]